MGDTGFISSLTLPQRSRRNYSNTVSYVIKVITRARRRETEITSPFVIPGFYFHSCCATESAHVLAEKQFSVFLKWMSWTFCGGFVRGFSFSFMRANLLDFCADKFVVCECVILSKNSLFTFIPDKVYFHLWKTDFETLAIKWHI